MTPLLQPRPLHAAIVVAIVGGAALATAWAFQIWGGYVPCALCLQQRVPYYVALPLVLLAALAALRAPSNLLSRLLLAAVALAFAYGAYLAAYHAGAEWGWWPGPSDCGGGAAASVDAGTFLSELRSARVVACDEAPWRFAGLSFAGWNFVISGALALVAMGGAIAAKRETA